MSRRKTLLGSELPQFTDDDNLDEEKEKEEKRVDIFFRDIEEKLEPTETSLETLYRLNRNKTESHQNQIRLKILQ